MEIFARLREKSKIISRIAAWQKSLWYPAVYAALGVLSCSCGYVVYIPVYYLLALSALFAALFCEDPKALLTPLLLSYFCAGSDGIHSYGQAVQSPAAFFQPMGLVNMYIAGAIIVASVLFRIIASGILADVFRAACSPSACFAWRRLFFSTVRFLPHGSRSILPTVR